MPRTQLDTNAALVLIDLHKGIVSRPTEHLAMAIVERAAKLAHGFRERGLPVFRQCSGAASRRKRAGPPGMLFPPDWTELAPALKAQESDRRMTKKSLGGFATRGLQELLPKLGVMQIFMASNSTSIGVESTEASENVLARLNPL